MVDDPELEELPGDVTATSGALGQFLRAQAVPGSSRHCKLTQVAAELTDSAQQQLRQVIAQSTAEKCIAANAGWR